MARRGMPTSSIVFQSASDWQGCVVADSMLISGLSTSVRHRAEAGLGEVGGEVLAVGEGADAERVGVGRQHRDALAHVFGRGAVHHRAEARLELPGALAGRDHERAAAEAHHPDLERRQRPQRGIEEHQAEDLARERGRLGVFLEPARERDEIDDLLAAEVGQVQESFHVEQFACRGARSLRATRAPPAAGPRVPRAGCRAAAAARRSGRRWCRRGCRAPAGPAALPSPAGWCAGRAGSPRPGGP